MPRDQARPFLTNAVLAVAYFAVGYVTLAIGETSGVELRRLVWLGSGVGLAVALIVPYRVWPGVMVGGFFVTLVSGDPLLHALVTGAANGFEIGLPAYVLRRMGFKRTLERIWDVVVLVFLAAGLAALVGALMSVTSLVVSGLSPASAFGRIWLLWWATHGVGMLVVTPPVLALWGTEPGSTDYRLEFAAVCAALVAIGGMSFMAPPESPSARFFFLCFPFLVWCAVRLGVAGAATGGSLVTMLAILGAESGRGPLLGSTESETLLLTWGFSNSVILTTLLAGALLAGANRARRDLLTGKRRLEAVLNTTQDGIVVADPQGLVLEANPGFQRLLGADEPLTGRPVAEVLRRLLERLQPGTEAPEWLRSADPDQAVADGLLHLVDGTTQKAHTAPMRSDTLPGRIWSFHDITERMEAEAERRRLQRQVLHSQKLEGLGLLAGGVAHDFNNLLSIIMGHADLLLADGLPPQARQDAHQIIHTAEDAAALCRQMLAYAGRGDYRRGPLDLSACTEDISRLLEVSLAPAAELEVERPDTPVMIDGDEVQLRQVLMNLVTNASDAVAPLGPRGRISVRTSVASIDPAWLSRTVVDDGLAPGPYALLDVEDNGVGMDEETASQIFDPFFSTKGTGRGLGLAATLGVVRGHGGAMRLDTQVDRGSRFRIVFPLLRESAGGDAIPGATPTASAPKADADGGARADAAPAPGHPAGA